MTVLEFVAFQKKFKPFSNGISAEELISKINLSNALNKPIRFLSSGMKQRLKLGITLYNDAPLLMLDEPTVNLDTAGIDWYREEMSKQLNNRTILICSNQRHEYDFCDRELKMSDYKK
jgi:ABC-type multidrug transport system ATPase subunit